MLTNNIEASKILDTPEMAIYSQSGETGNEIINQLYTNVTSPYIYVRYE